MFERDAAGGGVYALKPQCGAVIDAHEARVPRQFDRVDIGAKMMTRYAVKRFRTDDVLRRQLLGLMDDPRHRGLRYSKITAELAYRSGCIAACKQRFISGRANIHKWVAIQ
ncbi:hypothetical protein GCM10011614_17030 [Novosphingobium colocasiae]|uniref:Uncharacterized protein n=1 Tax=Novosphingobium colocasiae TaxID=1256513 RepID=A0A918PF98_9SPHN|nr:hypothetical protein GCM10011614_17030 [Novosphingobium colocasiae]